MGCDIHPAVEVRRNDGAWHYHRPKTACRYYYEINWKAIGNYGYGHDAMRDAQGQPIRSHYGDDTCKYGLPDFFYDRNYYWFSMLADVRNDSPGSPEYVEPIDVPRGLPADVTVMAESKLSSEHSQTWVTLRELIEYDYSQIVNGLFLLEHLPSAGKVIHYLKELVPRGGTTDDVRMVMDFDS